MKFKVGDRVIITNGKDKGKTSQITRVLPRSEKVAVENVNVFTKHVRKFGTRAGQTQKITKPIATAKIAILNEKGEPDRIAYQFDKNGQKQRIFAKTKTVISDQLKIKEEKKVKAEKKK